MKIVDLEYHKDWLLLIDIAQTYPNFFFKEGGGTVPAILPEMDI